MATNFFEQQENARRKTVWLVVYFLLSIVAIIGLLFVLIEVVLANTGNPLNAYENLGLLGGVSAGVLGVVGTGSFLKTMQLASGGSAVAQMMGGTLVNSGTTAAHEKMLLNVVEEMAIASGVPVPVVYVLEHEEGINAFAAGYTTGDAVIAVSRGCLEMLTRDELQGVVAHEFSHILNGDMRLNIRLIGIVFGLVGLAQLGYMIFRFVSESRTSGPSAYGPSRQSDGDRKGDNGQGFWLVLLVSGIAIYLLGLLGQLFGRLIQAAISRQREYLADASAVQFTRNPEGIAGALKKIGGYKPASRLRNVHAGEMSHLFFSDGFMGRRFSDLFATHPPLAERIRRIDPTFDGKFPEAHAPTPEEFAQEQTQAKPKGRGFPGFPKFPGMPGGGRMGLPGLPVGVGMTGVPLPIGLAAEQAVAEVGAVSPAEVNYAGELFGALPAVIDEAGRDPFSAKSLIYALLLDADPALHQMQLEILRRDAGAAEYSETLRLDPVVRELPDMARLPVLDLAMPALRSLSREQYVIFRERVICLVMADQRLSTFEYVLSCVLSRHLDIEFGLRGQPADWWRPSSLLPGRVETILALLAWQGAEGNDEEVSPEVAAKAFAAGMQTFYGGKGGGDSQLPARETVRLEDYHAAARQLGRAKPELRRRVMLGMAACVLEDGQMSARELELLRAMGDTIECPVPPLVLEGNG